VGYTEAALCATECLSVGTQSACQCTEGPGRPLSTKRGPAAADLNFAVSLTWAPLCPELLLCTMVTSSRPEWSS
jgi:hypothetical protein